MKLHDAGKKHLKSKKGQSFNINMPSHAKEEKEESSAYQRTEKKLMRKYAPKMKAKSEAKESPAYEKKERALMKKHNPKMYKSRMK